MPGPPPLTTAKPASDSFLEISSIKIEYLWSGLKRADPKTLTEGLIDASFWNPSTNSAIIWKIFHDSRLSARSMSAVCCSCGLVFIAGFMWYLWSCIYVLRLVFCGPPEPSVCPRIGYKVAVGVAMLYRCVCTVVPILVWVYKLESKRKLPQAVSTAPALRSWSVYPNSGLPGLQPVEPLT